MRATRVWFSMEVILADLPIPSTARLTQSSTLLNSVNEYRIISVLTPGHRRWEYLPLTTTSCVTNGLRSWVGRSHHISWVDGALRFRMHGQLISCSSITVFRNNIFEYEKPLLALFLRLHFGWNEIFSIRCLVNALWQFSWNTPSKTQCEWIHFGHFDRNEVSFGLVKYYIGTIPKWHHMETNICACKYKGNILFKLMMRNSNYNEKYLVPKKQNFIY